MSAATLGLVAMVWVLATGSLWFRRALAVRLPENRSAFVASMAAGVLLAAFAVWNGPGWWGGAAACVALAAGGLFLFTVAISAQKGGTGAFVVGQPVPDFEALDDAGRSFRLSSLAGHPVLLKFFRGHW